MFSATMYLSLREAREVCYRATGDEGDSTPTVRFGDPTNGSNVLMFVWSRAAAVALRAAADEAVKAYDALAADVEPDREPSAEQERAWDAREDDARGDTLDEPEFEHSGCAIYGGDPGPGDT